MRITITIDTDDEDSVKKLGSLLYYVKKAIDQEKPKPKKSSPLTKEQEEAIAKLNDMSALL